jgi:acyl-CoA thioester hydrolase
MSEFVWPLRVYYEDTDASGVVYHANYLRYFERARTEWLRAMGLGQERLMADIGVAFTVASLEIDFRLPARLDDELEVRTSVTRVRHASLIFEQTLFQAGSVGVLTRATVRIGCVSRSAFRPVPLPDALHAAIEAWRNRMDSPPP